MKPLKFRIEQSKRNPPAQIGTRFRNKSRPQVKWAKCGPILTDFGRATKKSINTSKCAQRSPGSDEPKIPRKNSPVAPSYGQTRAQKRPDWVSAQFQAKFGPILTDFGPTTKKSLSIAQNVRNGLPVPRCQNFPENSAVAKKMLYGGLGLGGGVKHRTSPPGQNLTDGVNRLGP